MSMYILMDNLGVGSLSSKCTCSFSAPRYFHYALYSTVSCPILCYGTYRIYRWVEDRMESHPVAESIVFDRKRNSLRIYIADTLLLCGCWGMRNRAKLIWKCPLSALQRCEYLEEGRVTVFYYFDDQKRENELRHFRKMYFVNSKWEQDINRTLEQCKRDWKINTQMK